jgi:ferredoxin
MKAKVNPDLCDGMAVCEQMCPDVFEVKDGISTVKVDDVPSDAEQSCRQAAEGCPMAAITIDQ